MLSASTARPDLPVVFHSAVCGEALPLAELVDRAGRTAAAFRDLGVVPGDAVAVQVPSWVEGVVAQAAALLVGAVLVPVVPIYGPRELGFILRESRARLLVVPDRWGRRDYLADLPRIGAITDRRKDLIIRGGENLSSKQIEDILTEHEAVSEAAVVAAPDPLYGERVCAFVVLRPRTALSLTDIRAHFSTAGTARQLTPERLEIVDSLPRTATGKVRKADLRQRLRAAPDPAHLSSRRST
jgi:acyl-CoA synthetase (AMP-forming)/AMP-acid ligase II